MTTPAQSEPNYRDILAALTDGTIVIDAEQRIVLFNDAAQELIGVGASRVLGKPVAHLLHAIPRLGEILTDCIDSGRNLVDWESTLITSSREEVPVRILLSPIRDRAGSPAGVVVTIHDLRHAKRLEEADKQADRLGSMQVLCAGVAHEVRGPLVGIRGAAQLLGEQLADESLKEYTAVIVREVDRLSGIIANLTNLSGSQELRVADLDIHELLDDVLLLLRKELLEAGIRTVRTYDPSIPRFLADRDRLTQVFLNLVRNALQAMEPGGRLHLLTRVSHDYHYVRASEGNRPVPMVVIEVRDVGKGMSEEERRRLITPFYTTKPGGTGLGLTISHGIVQQHGGTMTIASEKGKGTIVAVYLPLRRGDGGEAGGAVK